jgi:hypothetical protein
MKQGDVATQDEAVILPANFIGQFDHDVSVDSAQGVTGIGFRPSSVIFLANVNTGGGNASIGFGNLTQDKCIMNVNEQTPDAWSRATVSAFVMLGAAAENSFTVTSLDIDGFTVTWSKSGTPTGTARTMFMAFK